VVDAKEAAGEAVVTVAVVIPTTGRRDTLVRALESVRGQSCQVDETIVVVDGQNDGLAKVSIPPLRSNERVVRVGGNRGGAYARNLGVRHASSDYVCFLDDDDWWATDKVALQLAHMRASGRTWAFTYVVFHHRNGRDRILPRYVKPSTDSYSSHLITRSGILHGDGYMQTSTLMVDRSLMLRVGWDESLRKHQDWDLVIRLAREAGDPACVPYPVVHVEQQAWGTSISSEPAWQQSADFLQRHASDMSRRAVADFAWTHIIRSALAERSFIGLVSGLKLSAWGRPHGAAFLIGCAGVREHTPARRARIS
jgi:glycosyltransferase involved in cell wall biosynthesis